MKEIKIHIIILLIFIAATGYTQQFPVTTQYLFNPYALSPSMAGVTGYSELFMNYRTDLTGIEGHPRTFRFNGFGNIYKYQMWLGGDMYMDNTDIFSKFKASLSYTYKLKVQNEQFIFFGVWGSFYQNAVNYANAVGVDPNDPLFQNSSKITAAKFNAGFGINYNWKRFNVGLSIPTLFTSRQEVENSQGVTFNQKQEFLFHISNIFSLARQWDIQAYGVFRKTTNDPVNFEISAMLIYLKRFWSGLLFRKGGALGINLGGNLIKGMVFNYSYEIPVGGINARSGGSHEITLGWRIGIKSNKYFEYNREYYKNQRESKNRSKSRKDYPPVYDYRYRRINK
jgi:type IX secretion system PorP/SprF family membrane protein